MRKILILYILGILTLCGCDRTIWDTSRGNMSVSFRVDGTRYICAEKNEFVESPLRLSFYDATFLDFHVDGFDRKTGEDKGCLTFTVSDIKPIVTGKRYNLRYYSGSAEDRVADPPVFFAEFNGFNRGGFLPAAYGNKAVFCINADSNCIAEFLNCFFNKRIIPDCRSAENNSFNAE